MQAYAEGSRKKCTCDLTPEHMAKKKKRKKARFDLSSFLSHAFWTDPAPTIPPGYPAGFQSLWDIVRGSMGHRDDEIREGKRERERERGSDGDLEHPFPGCLT